MQLLRRWMSVIIVLMHYTTEYTRQVVIRVCCSKERDIKTQPLEIFSIFFYDYLNRQKDSSLFIMYIEFPGIKEYFA